MQDEKEELRIKKTVFLQTAGKVAVKLRKMGKMKFSFKYNFPLPSLLKFEEGSRDLQITTVCRLAQAYGMKCSEFIKLVEDELPEGFTF